MISVLCPSRGRAKALEISATSLMDMAAKPDNIEILTRIDLDDPKLKEYKLSPVVHKIQVGVGHGYPGLYIYYNNLAGVAKGDWLFMWNDDVLMETPDWDLIIESFTGQFLCLAPETRPHGRMFTIIPVVPKEWFSVVGHLSLNSQADFWLMEIAQQLGIFQWVPIHSLHDRADITGNNNDATFAARNHQSKQYYSPEQTALRQVDADKLREYLKTKSLAP